MRALTAVAASVVGAGALVLAWNAGDRPSVTQVVAAGPALSPTSTAPPTRGSASAPASAPSPQSAGGSVASSSSPAGIDHQVTGPTVSTRYGPVQVKVDLSGSRITDVVAVQLTNSNRTSMQISASAAPILRQEALQAQSAQIDTVSGATYTSEGYQQSLQAALDAAHA